MTTTASNPYLEGAFAPVNSERTVVDLPVTGKIPEHLAGRYMRIGPNPVGTVDAATYHWFLGDGMVHGIQIRDGKAEWYRNRWVRSKAVAKALGEHSRPGPIHAGFDFSANTHVVGFNGRTFALVEAGSRPYELTHELDTIGPCDFDGTLPGGYTAHPLRDPETGELHAISYFFGWANKVQYSIIGTNGRVRRTLDIEVGGSPMMHAFSLTEKYVVIYDLPVTFDAHKAASQAPKLFSKPTEMLMSRTVGRRRVPDRVVAAMFSTSSNSATLPYSWDPKYPARVGVLPREGTTVTWFDVEPCYVYHPLNAYDDGDRIVLDVVRHPKMFATEHRGPNEGPPTLDRWTVDLTAGKVLEERIDDRGQEFPRIDERLVGKRHRYGYAVGFGGQPGGPADTESHAIIKHDLLGAGTESRSLGKTTALDEFVFVANGPDAGEDEGVVMGFVYRKEDDRSDLVMLDAATLETVAEIHLPARVPHGFHGSWAPNR